MAGRLGRRILSVGAGVAGLVLAVYALAWWRADPVALLESEVTRLRERGFATSHGEWHPDRVPGSQNGGVGLIAADAWLREHAGTESSWAAPGPWRNDLPEDWWTGASEDDMAALDRFLEELRPYFRRVEQALGEPHLRLCAGADQLGGTADVDAHLLLRLIRLDEARTRRATDAAQIARAVTSRLRLARCIERPSVVVSFQALHSVRSATRDVRDALVGARAPASRLRASIDADLAFSTSDRFPELCRADIVDLVASIRWAQAGGARHGDDLRSSFFSLGRSPSERVIAWLAFGGPDELLRAAAECAEVDAVGLPERMRRLRDIESRQRRYARVATASARRCALLLSRTDANLRLARLALAATERRETTGAWPASLDDLRDMFPDGVPLDPFTERPFVYEVRGRAVRIASAGRCDDEPAVSEQELIDDGLVWTIER